MSHSIYKVGDRVIRNKVKIQDSNAIPENSLGTVVHVDGKDSYGYLYIVNWDTRNSHTYSNYDYPNTWAIYEGCLNHLDNLTQEERKQQQLLDKIKYLNQRYTERKQHVRI